MTRTIRRIIAWFNRDLDWHDAFWPGTMQRRVNGKWESRPATEAEEWERINNEAW